MPQRHPVSSVPLPGSTPSLAKIKCLGPREPWHLAFLLPDRWDDLRVPIDDFRIDPSLVHTPVLLRGRVPSPPTTNFDGPAPRTTGRLEDREGRLVGFTVFGDSRTFTAGLVSPDVLLFGELNLFNGRPWLTNPQRVDPVWAGHLRPAYPGKAHVISPGTVRSLVLGALREAIPEAARWIRSALSAGIEDPDVLDRVAGLGGDPIERILWFAHRPRTPEEGVRAHQTLERLAALAAWRRADAHQLARGQSYWNTPAEWTARARALPFGLTDDQRAAVSAIVDDLRGAVPMARLLSGDVGTGKTAVFGLAAAACVDGGGRVAILLPNERLADQVCRNLGAWWPDLAPLLVTGSTRDPDTALQGSRLLIGTTAMLHRSVGRFALVVVDEQQKFSREQREALSADGAHVLEASATCIPRSQALMRYGIIQVSRLAHGHVQKTIHTRIWHGGERQALFEAIARTLADGHQVIIVYPRKQAARSIPGDDPDEAPARSADRTAAESAFTLWQKQWPGRVVLAHGGLDEACNAAAMEAMRSGRAAVLVATTVAEVGIDLPGVRRLVVVRPEFLGLTQLHQLRGRVARTGGEGWFDLFLQAPVKEPTMERLAVLVDTQDGFAVAEKDLELRGFGDLGTDSEQQSGADETFLFGRPVQPERLNEVLQAWDALRSRCAICSGPKTRDQAPGAVVAPAS